MNDKQNIKTLKPAYNDRISAQAKQRQIGFAYAKHVAQASRLCFPVHAPTAGTAVLP